MSEGKKDDVDDTMPGGDEISSKIAELTYTPYARISFLHRAGFNPGRENGFRSRAMDSKGWVVPSGDGLTWCWVAAAANDAAKIYRVVAISTRVEVHR